MERVIKLKNTRLILMRCSLILVLALNLICAESLSASENRGIMIFYRYQFSNPWGDLIDNPNVIGGRKQAYWAEVNPSQGVYDWQEIDEALEIARNAGKKVGLAIPFSGYGGWQNPYAANGVPDWVYALGEGEGVDYLEWDGPPYTRYAVFWSNTIKTHFQTFVEELGSRYNNHPDLEYVIIGLYPEMNLGKDANNLLQEWQDAGYTDDLYENTVKWYIDLYAENFPNTQLSLACLSSKPIDLMSTARFEELKDNICDYMDAKPNGGIENNAMRDFSNWDFIQQWFRKHHETAHIIYEAVDKASGTGRAGDFRTMLENGMTAHADHFQIYYEDIKVATPGQWDYDPEYESALAFAANQVGLEPNDPERDNVWLRYNGLDVLTGSKKFFFQGLYCDGNAPYDSGEWPVGKLRPQNGEYLVVASAGSPSRECVKTNQPIGDEFIYLDVDDRFIFGDTSKVEIKIEYLDEGADGFLLEYDGLNGAYAQTNVIIKKNTGTWKTAVFQIDDAVFKNSQEEGNDFRISCNGDGDEYISFVHVKKDTGITTSINNFGDTNFPSEYYLAQNYPNPFNPVTTISFKIPKNEKVALKVYNTKGMEIATLVNCKLNAGSHSYQFNAGTLSSGVYFYVLFVGNAIEVRKAILLK